MDYIIGIDPGYATIGIAALQKLDAGYRLHGLVSAKSESRVQKVKEGPPGRPVDCIPELGNPHPNDPAYPYQLEELRRCFMVSNFVDYILRQWQIRGRVLFIIEDWFQGTPGQHRTGYLRGFVDFGIVNTTRHWGGFALVHNAWVRQFKNAAGHGGVAKDDARQALMHLSISTPWIQGLAKTGPVDPVPGLINDSPFYVLNRKDEDIRLTKTRSVSSRSHFVDALAMAIIGATALDPSLWEGRPAKQVLIARKMRGRILGDDDAFR